MAEWQPATPEEIHRYLVEGIAEFLPADRPLFEQYRVEPFLVFINRLGTEGEKVYVVARKGDRVIVFEDVEDKFALGTLVAQDRVEVTGWFNSLGGAIRTLAAS